MLLSHCLPPPKGTHVLLWTLKDKRSHWVDTLEAARSVVEQANAEKSDVYVGVAYSPEDYGPARRCPAESTAGIGGLWIDIDIAGDGHKKPNLPPSSTEAFELLDQMPLKPSLVIHSGGGLQCWWLFREPWVFDDDAERDEAARLAHRFNATFRTWAHARGWDVDSTADLARVMRVPGSYNWKTGEPREVKIVKERKVRYNPSEFEDYLVEGEPAKMREPDEGDYSLERLGDPPFMKFQALCENEPEFQKSWERKRKDFPDQSASSYDLSLASYAAMVGWTDQEIVNLLVASRRLHGDDLKLRRDYYDRTLQRARGDSKKAEAMSVLDEDRADTPKDKLRAISDMFGIEITRIERYTTDPPIYVLHTSGGRVDLGGVDGLITQNKLRNAIATATKILVPKYKGPKWDKIAQALLSSTTDIDPGKEATTGGMVMGWLTEYVEERPPIQDRTEAVEAQHPHTDGVTVWIFGGEFRSWLRVNKGERVNQMRLGMYLRSVGAEPEQVYYRKPSGSGSTKHAYRLPEGVL